MKYKINNFIDNELIKELMGAPDFRRLRKALCCFDYPELKIAFDIATGPNNIGIDLVMRPGANKKLLIKYYPQLANQVYTRILTVNKDIARDILSVLLNNQREKIRKFLIEETEEMIRVSSAKDDVLVILERMLQERNIKKLYRVWFHDDNTLVVDLRENYIKIALDLVKVDDKVFLLVFGRDLLSRDILNNHIVPLNDWCDKNRDSLSKIIINEWTEAHYLEEIVEYIYELIMELSKQLRSSFPKAISRSINNINKNVLLNIKEKIKNTKIVRIGFLVSERQKWNCQTLWDELNRNIKIKCKIYLHVYREDQINDQLEFFQKIDPELICLYDTKSQRNRAIHDYGLDLIFCQQPWTGLNHQVRNTLGKALVVYMHYGFLVYANSEMQYQQWDFHPFLWRYFSQSDLQKEIHLEHDPSIIGRQVVTGYPKLDVYFDKPNICPIWTDNDSQIKVIYAPHHAMSKKSLNISTFPWNFELLLSLSQQYNQVTQWVYKPHGRLKYSVVENNIMSKEAYELYIKSWKSQRNTAVYDDGNYFDLFRTSDVLITDCGSFLGEYFPTGKPIIWLISEDANVELNEIGEKLSKGFYKVRNTEELISVFEDIVINRNDSLKAYREKIIHEVFSLEKKATDKIVNYLVDVFNI